MGLELIETIPVIFDVVPIIEPFTDDDVHPGQKEGDIRTGLDGHPLDGFAGSHGKPGIDGDHLGSVSKGFGELLHLGVVHVLAQVTSDEDQASWNS